MSDRRANVGDGKADYVTRTEFEARHLEILTIVREIASTAKLQAGDVAELRGWVKGAIVVFGMFAASNIIVTVLH